MAKILILYYSSYGHTATMAEAAAEGVREGGGEAVVKRVPETAPDDVVKAAGFQHDTSHEVATVEELADYDGIIVGTPTRYGRISSQMASFWDRTGGLWASGKLVGKVGSAFTSTASQHGGNEMTLFSTITNLMHMGMVIVGLPYSYQGLVSLDEVSGGTPYGASTIAGGDGSRQPSENELGAMRFQGKVVAETAAKLAG